MNLDSNSLRVLGVVMEKEMTTPDQYPLSVNALVAGCNQRSSREPVMTLSEDDVRSALHRLEDAGLVAPARDSARVPRYEHRIRTVLQLRRDETALLCLLLLRGPQTVGELRGRSERMFAFDDLSQTQATLDRMSGREEALVAALGRAAGSRETRYVHLLGGPVAAHAAEQPPRSAAPVFTTTTTDETLPARLAALEERVAELERMLAERQ